MKKLLITCGVLALTAGAANAATILTVDASGSIGTTAGSPSQLSIEGTATGDAFFNLDETRDYTVSFSGSYTPTAPAGSASFFSDVFSFTGNLADAVTFAPIDPTSGFILALLGDPSFSGIYTGLTLTPPTAYSIGFNVTHPTAGTDFQFLTGTAGGTFDLVATFTAAVPLPASLPLALSAFGLMGYVGSRKKKDVAAA